MITVVGGNKGGSGKTTIASNLAIALANKGREVCLLNGDLQRTAAKHHAEREAAGLLPAITLVEKFDNLTQTLQALNEKFDDVIVDEAQDFENSEILYFKDFTELREGHFFAFYDKK